LPAETDRGPYIKAKKQAALSHVPGSARLSRPGDKHGSIFLYNGKVLIVYERNSGGLKMILGGVWMILVSSRQVLGEGPCPDQSLVS